MAIQGEVELARGSCERDDDASGDGSEGAGDDCSSEASEEAGDSGGGSSSEESISSSGDDDHSEDGDSGGDYSQGDGDAYDYDGYEIGSIRDEYEIDEYDIHSRGDGVKIHKKATHRMIVLILSTLLATLLVNFGYGLFQLSRLSESDLAPLNGVAGVDFNAGSDSRSNTYGDSGRIQTAPSHNRQEKKVGEDNNSDADPRGSEQKSNPGGSKQQENLDGDDEEYEMPRHPTRIYTHAALSSKNYRAGGVLSDEMLRRFEEDGAIVIRNLISPKLLDRLDSASRMLIDGQNESTSKKRGKQFHMVKNGAIFLGVPPPLKGEVSSCAADAGEDGEACGVNTDDNVILSSFRDLALYSKIPRVAASLLRLDELRVGGEQYLKLSRHQKAKHEDGFHIDDSINLRVCRDIFLTKDDDPYACGWHVDDTGFWPSLASDPGVNAWVALDDMGGTSWPAASAEPGDPSKSTSAGPDGGTDGRESGPVATLALSLGSHRAPWRHEAYRVTGSTHTVPPEGYKSAADLIRRRSGSGTCNIQTSAPDLYEKLEANKVVYDLKRGDVIFHHRWVFHRTVTVGEYDKMMSKTSPGEGKSDKIFRRYSIRYAPGTAVVPPGYGVEPSVLHDPGNANRTLDDVVGRSGPWYPKAWPVSRHGVSNAGVPTGSGVDGESEETEGMAELVHGKMPGAERLQGERKREIQRLLKARGGR